jgi:23S rRNA (guanosine2251-2'-O)-methyltransferase
MGRKLRNEELERLSTEQFKEAEKIEVVVVLDNVRSLLNVGSIFRTCDAFLVKSLYLCGLTGTPPHKEIEKTALGATETVAWKHFESTQMALTQLKEQGYKVFAVEQAEQSISLENFSDQSPKIAVVFGNEVYGVEQEAIDNCNGVLEIPQLGSKHSLNVAVSAGIVLWQIALQRHFD